MDAIPDGFLDLEQIREIRTHRQPQLDRDRLLGVRLQLDTFAHVAADVLCVARHEPNPDFEQAPIDGAGLSGATDVTPRSPHR
nr:hypothetical protein [Plantactinospora mayteni]